MTPIDALYRQADDHPDNVAFISGNDTWSYRRLGAEVEHVAQALLARGLQSGDRVALHMANRPELAIAYYACFRIGAMRTTLVALGEIGGSASCHPATNKVRT